MSLRCPFFLKSSSSTVQFVYQVLPTYCKNIMAQTASTAKKIDLKFELLNKKAM